MSDRVVQLCRTWIGTPYVHQAAIKGAGTDCLGLIRGLWCELFGAEPEAVPAYTPDWGEIGGQEVLMQAGLRHLVQVPPQAVLAPGQVLLFRMRQTAVAKHLGILTVAGEAPGFVHAYDGHGVIESPLSGPWRRRIAMRFRFPKH